MYSKTIFFSGGADDFDEVEDDPDLDEIDQPEVKKLFLFIIIIYNYNTIYLQIHLK